MRLIVEEIRDAVLAIGVASGSFINGRSFDSALESGIVDTADAFVFLDPVQKTGVFSSRQETYSISIGFLKQDSPDSSEDQREDIVDEMDQLCLDFLQKMFDINVLDDGTILMFDAYNVVPVYRIKNVCSGVLCTFSVTAQRPC